MPLFDNSDHDRPECFDRPGDTWSRTDRDDATIYLFTGINLKLHLALAVRVTHNLNDAEDATSEYVAGRGIEKPQFEYPESKFHSVTIPRFDPNRAPFEGWHCIVFKTHCYEWMRRNRGRLEFVDDDDLMALIAAFFAKAGVAGGDAAFSSEVYQALHECLAQLPAEDQKLIQRHYSCNESLKKIAKVFDITDFAARKRHQRIRRKLLWCLTERIKPLNDCVASLDEKDREVFRRRCECDEPWKEIAHALGIEPKEAKQRFKNVTKKFIKYLIREI